MRRSTSVLLAAAAVIIAAGAVVFAIYNSDLAGARAALTGGGAKIVNTSAGPIEYAERGPTSGVPLLSIHGAGGGWDQGLTNVADLVGQGFHVIAPSRFGYLGTPIPADASPAAQADAHAALLAELKIPKAVVVGISAGARSAVELAIRHPDEVAALILIVPGTYAPSSPVAIEASRGSELAFQLVNTGADFAWWTLERVAPSILVRFIGVKPEVLATAPKAEQDRVTAIVRSIEPLSARVAGINIDSTPDLTRLPLETMAVPTLIFSARDDLFNTLPAAEFAASTIPDAKLVVYDTGGHLLVGHQQDTRVTVADFLFKAGVMSPSAKPVVAAAQP
jgi:2-hydroxy-6-oxonona-2,4-dienedioate hydrolase